MASGATPARTAWKSAAAERIGFVEEADWSGVLPEEVVFLGTTIGMNDTDGPPNGTSILVEKT